MKKFLTALVVVCATVVLSVFVGCETKCAHYSMTVDSTTATCTSAGVETWKCLDCSYTETRNVEAYKHRYETRDKDGNTVTSSAYWGINRYCIRCNEEQFTVSCNLPADVTSTVAGKKTSGIKVKSFTFEVDGNGDWIGFFFVCEKTADYTTSVGDYKVLAVTVTISDTLHTGYDYSDTMVYHEQQSHVAEEEMAVGDEFEMESALHLRNGVSTEGIKYTPADANGEYLKGNFVLTISDGNVTTIILN